MDRDVAIATVRAFCSRSAAARVAVLLDEGADRPPLLIEHERGGPVEVTEDGRTSVAEPAGAEPLPVEAPSVPASAIDADVEEGELAAPIGAIAAMATAILALARALGGRTVASADFATRGGETLTIAARDGEPLVLTLGEHQYELPAGWP